MTAAYLLFMVGARGGWGVGRREGTPASSLLSTPYLVGHIQTEDRRGGGDAEGLCLQCTVRERTRAKHACMHLHLHA
eukprot:279297-Chlamydomonas_euryale.AAC.3